MPLFDADLSIWETVWDWDTVKDLHTPYWRVSFGMTLSDIEWFSKIVNDTKHRTVSLRQLSFLLSLLLQWDRYPHCTESICCFRNAVWDSVSGGFSSSSVHLYVLVQPIITFVLDNLHTVTLMVNLYVSGTIEAKQLAPTSQVPYEAVVGSVHILWQSGPLELASRRRQPS